VSVPVSTSAEHRQRRPEREHRAEDRERQADE
jgi:hypothetical protein